MGKTGRRILPTSKLPRAGSGRDRAPHHGVPGSYATGGIAYEGTVELDKWLEAVETEPSLRTAIIDYIRAYGWAGFGESVRQDTTILLRAGQEQDLIGWRNFTLGRFSSQFREIMAAHYAAIESLRRADTWAKGLVNRLLELTHDIWEVRNDFAHGRQEDGLKRDEAIALREEISAAFMEGPEGLLPEDAYLFQRSFDALRALSARDQRQWLIELEAARKAATVEQRETLAEEPEVEE